MPARINFGCILSGDSNGHFLLSTENLDLPTKKPKKYTNKF